VAAARAPGTAAILAVALGLGAVFGANFVAHRAHAPAAEAPRSPDAPPSSQTWQALPEPDSDGRARDSADAESEDWGHAVLAELKQRPFSGTESFVRAVLASPENPTEVKIAAVESLENSTPEAIELLLETAAEAEDPELRAAAVESLAWLDESDDIQGALLDLLETESSAEVRAELYSALAFDPGETYANAPLDDLVRMVLSERRPEARVQGFRLVASLLRFHPDPHLAETFDRDMVPWLWEEALREGSRYARLVSIDALKLASTSAAAEALENLSRSQEAAVAEAADHALFAQARLRRIGRGVTGGR
jgi:hypothetical protein